MRVSEEADGSLLVTNQSTRGAAWMLAAAIALLGIAAYDWWIGPRGGERMVALLASAGMFLLGAVVMREKASFRFDPVGKTVVWDRLWGLRRRSGTTAFQDIRDVAVETPIGDTGVPSRRICLHLSDGTTVPIAVGYRPDTNGEIARTAERIRSALGKAPRPSPSDSARLLVERGKVIDAIKVLREGEGLSLTEAKRRVDEMKTGG